MNENAQTDSTKYVELWLRSDQIHGQQLCGINVDTIKQKRQLFVAWFFYLEIISGL